MAGVYPGAEREARDKLPGKWKDLAKPKGYANGAQEAHAAHYDVHVMMDCFFRGLEWNFFHLPETAVSTELSEAA